RDAALALQDESDDEEEALAVPEKRRRKGKGKQKPLSAMELRDKRYFLEYITTDKCRRIVWNKFFGNKDKEHLIYPVPPGACCDNCNPEAFEVQTIALVGGTQIKAGRKATSSPELESAVRQKLNEVREEIIAADYPNQHFLTGNIIIPDAVVDALAKRARLVNSVDTLLQQTRWIQAPRYGEIAVKSIQEITAKFPDLAKAARETQAAEKQQKMVNAAAFKELRSRLVQVFDGCYNAVY
ncbi:hypothetical protein K438DRAFT_1527228, partial [Mycena galopus ATCC 62051]